jgi:hypothetical protein
MPTPSTTSTRATAIPANAGDTINALEAQLAAMRAERDDLQDKLAKAGATAAAAALTLPYPAMPANYHESVISVLNGRLSYEQCLALRALFNGLYASRAVIKDGAGVKPVYLPHHAVQWLLENLKFQGG